MTYFARFNKSGKTTLFPVTIFCHFALNPRNQSILPPNFVSQTLADEKWPNLAVIVYLFEIAVNFC